MDNECPFCMEFDPDTSQESQYYALNGQSLPSRVLMAQDGFFLVPAIGQIMEGYCLLIPRVHVTCAGLLSEDHINRMQELEDVARTLIAREYATPVVSFEHGCNRRGAQAGACIDHAHIHIMPVETDPTDRVFSHLDALSWESMSGLSTLRRFVDGNLPYLYIRDTFGRQHVAPATCQIPSQFLRQIIAATHDKPGLWDWRANPLFARLVKTHNRLATVLSECTHPCRVP